MNATYRITDPKIPLWSQKLQREQEVPVLWDYHVILRHAQNIYDFDSTLCFPEDIQKYIRETMHPEIQLREEFCR